MIKLDSIVIATSCLEHLTKFLIDIFEMEISGQFGQYVELSSDNVNLRLVQDNLATIDNRRAYLLFCSHSLEEIEQLMQRVEFFYFSTEVDTPPVTVENKLDREQLISIFAPDSSRWDIFYLN